jgi:hypothetical protein
MSKPLPVNTLVFDDGSHGYRYTDEQVMNHCADSWEYSQVPIAEHIEWNVTDDPADMTDDVSVSPALLGALWSKARAYDALMASGGCTGGCEAE